MAIHHFNTGSFAKALKGTLPVLVDFWAPWCLPCKRLAPVLEELEKELDGKAIVGKINVDEEKKLVEMYGVMSIPTLLLFVNGKPVKSLVGLVSKANMIDMIRPYLMPPVSETPSVRSREKRPADWDVKVTGPAAGNGESSSPKLVKSGAAPSLPSPVPQEKAVPQEKTVPQKELVSPDSHPQSENPQPGKRKFGRLKSRKTAAFGHTAPRKQLSASEPPVPVTPQVTSQVTSQVTRVEQGSSSKKEETKRDSKQDKNDHSSGRNG